MLLKNQKARDVMRKAVTVDPDRTVAHAEILLKRNNSDYLCVTKGGYICGVFYKSDISNSNLKNVVADFTSPCRMSVVSTSDLSFILQLIKDEQLHSLLVMEKGECVGIITRNSLYEDGYIQ